MGRTAESDSVSDASASLGKSTSSSQVGAASLDAVAAVDMFQKRHGTSVLPLRRIDTRAPVMEGDGPRVCALVCPLPVCARYRFSGDSRVRGGPLACVAVPVWGRGRAGASEAGLASRGKIARPTVGFLFLGLSLNLICSNHLLIRNK